MTLRDYLSIPYLLEAYSVEHAPDHWSRHVSYPELPGCTAQADVLEDAIDELERTRIRTVLTMLRRGQAPPVPRAPLVNSDPLGLARELGLADEIAPLLDRRAADLRLPQAAP